METGVTLETETINMGRCVMGVGPLTTAVATFSTPAPVFIIPMFNFRYILWSNKPPFWIVGFSGVLEDPSWLFIEDKILDSCSLTWELM
jgi:hypothetical protein